MTTLYKIMLTLVIIGAINWGLIGMFNVNLVELIFGADSFVSNLIYSLVGIAGLVTCGLLFKRFDDRNKVNAN